MKNVCLILFISLLFIAGAHAQKTDTTYRDIYPDTWVGTDALGRKMPTITIAGPLKKDHRRVVGMFYVTWHTADKAKLKSPYDGDVTKVLQADSNARKEANNKQWKEESYHWGKPEMGYFLSKDEYVIRRDMSMLSDAGVDMIIFDVTNAAEYWDEWQTILTVMEKMRAEGNKTPQFCFWAFNGPVITVVQNLYEKIYKAHKFQDLWFYWDGKPKRHTETQTQTTKPLQYLTKATRITATAIIPRRFTPITQTK